MHRGIHENLPHFRHQKSSRKEGWLLSRVQVLASDKRCCDDLTRLMNWSMPGAVCLCGTAGRQSVPEQLVTDVRACFVYGQVEVARILGSVLSAWSSIILEYAGSFPPTRAFADPAVSFDGPQNLALQQSTPRLGISNGIERTCVWESGRCSSNEDCLCTCSEFDACLYWNPH